VIIRWNVDVGSHADGTVHGERGTGGDCGHVQDGSVETMSNDGIGRRRRQ